MTHYWNHFNSAGYCQCDCDDCTLRLTEACVCLDCKCIDEWDHKVNVPLDEMEGDDS